MGEDSARNQNKLLLFCGLVGDPTVGELDQVPEAEAIAQRFLRPAVRPSTAIGLQCFRVFGDDLLKLNTCGHWDSSPRRIRGPTHRRRIGHAAIIRFNRAGLHDSQDGN